MENRNLKNRSTIQKLSSFFIVCLFVLIGIVGNANIARADPHGIYYTAVGQQQLFFNVLAALDQADYVETALAREEKREAREEVDAEQPFIREEESGARFTKETELKQDDNEAYPSEPGEPDLVNRQVTLEGADIYTDQLVRQFGAESARRNAAAELLQVLCENGFGFKDCDADLTGIIDPKEKLEILTRRSNTTVVNPLAWASLPVTNGLWAAFNSGNTTKNVINPDPDPEAPEFITDKTYREGKMLNPDLYGSAPLAYSKNIATWRTFIEDETMDRYTHKDNLDNILIGSSKNFTSSKKIVYPYQEYMYTPDGISLVGLVNCGNSLCMKASPPPWSIARDPDTDTVVSYMAAVADMAATAPQSANDIGIRAMQRIAAQQKEIEDKGVLAKTTLINNPTDPTDPTDYGELTISVDVPVAAREASIYGIPNVLGMLATSQQASSLEGLDIPGNVQLVKRAGSSQPECNNGIDDDEDGDIDYPYDPQCDSPTDTSESEAGEQGLIRANGPQVAGTLDLLFDSNATPTPSNFLNFDAKKEETSPSANIISPILEFGARHALRMLTAGKWRESATAGITCGFTCD